MMVIQHIKIIKKCKQLKKLNLLKSYHLKKQEALTKNSNETEKERKSTLVDRFEEEVVFPTCKKAMDQSSR